MPNKWITFVKNWSAKNNVSYACALSMPELKDAYRKKHGIAKPLGKNVERGLMGAEDKDAPAPPKRSATPSVRQLDLVPLKDIIDKREKARENKERWSMTGEDISSRLSQQVEKDKKEKAKEKKERWSMTGEDISSRLSQQVEKEKREMESMGKEDRDVGKGGKYLSILKKIEDLMDEDYRLNRDEIKEGLESLLNDYNNNKMSASIEKKYDELVSKNNRLYKKYKEEVEVRKKERKQSSKEREMMGAEDVNVKSLTDEMMGYIKTMESGEKIDRKIIEFYGGLYHGKKMTKKEGEVALRMIRLYNSLKRELSEQKKMGAEDIDAGKKTLLDEIKEHIEERKKGIRPDRRIIEEFGELYKSDKLSKNESDAVRMMVDLYNNYNRSIKERKEREKMGAEDINRAEKKVSKSGETENQVFQYLKKKAEDAELSNISNLDDILRNLAKRRVKAGLTINDEENIKKMSREDLRAIYREAGFIYGRSGANKMSKAEILEDLFITVLYGDDSVDYDKLKEMYDELVNVGKKERVKSGSGIKLTDGLKERLTESIFEYLYQNQVLELSRLLGIVPSKKDTKKDTFPRILTAIEEGLIDFNDLFKAIRKIEKNFTNESTRSYLRGENTFGVNPKEMGHFYNLKRVIDFEIKNYNKNFGNPDDPTDYNKIFDERNK